MKKRLLIALALMLSLYTQAQISFEATSNYGRLQDITYDPLVQNKLYAVSNAGNHILVSTDNKASWSILYSFPNSGAQISQMKLLPGSNALSFIISYTNQQIQDGIYIYNLTSNTITNFYPIPNISDSPAIRSYSIYDAGGIHVLIHDAYTDGFVGGPRTKIFYTTNSGVTWNEVYYSENFDTVHVNNVAICPTNPNKLFVARSFSPGDIDGGLLVSEDAGNTWTESLPGIILDPISFNPTNSNDIIIGTGIAADSHPENLYRSTDGGTTWTILPNDWNTNFGYNNINKIIFNPSNPTNIVVLEEDVLAVSNDNGVSWTNTVYEQNDDNSYYAGLNASFNPFVSGEIVISSPYYPQFSTNGGLTISQLQIPFYNVASVSSALYGSESHIYYGAQGGRVHKNLTTGTANTTEIQNAFEFSPPKHYVIADPVVPGRMFSFSGGGFIGGSFNVNTNYDQNQLTLMIVYADDIRALAVDPNNTNTVYVAFRNGEGSSLYKIDFADSSNVQTTEIITPGIYVEGLGNGVVTGIAVSPIDSQIIYLVQRDKFYKSTDGGTTWQEKSNGITLDPNNIIWDMAMNPFNQNEFTIANDNGIFTTSDDGENWIQTHNEATHKVKYSPFTAGLIAVGARRPGALLYSLTNGTNWTIITPQQLNYVAAQAIDFNFIGNNIDAYIATSDLGVIKYQIQNLPLGTINPQPNGNSLIIYPNPASNVLNISLDDNLNQIESIEAFTITGQKIYNTNETSFDISNWSSGIYLIKVMTTDGQSCVQKVVKS